MKLKFKDILLKTQEELKKYCYRELLKRNYKKNNLIMTDDYLYAKGNIPILLVAHLDTVHKEKPSPIVYDRLLKIYWSPTGIGGDDRCGIYAILKICETFRPYVLFTTDEEVGGLGVRKFVKEVNNIPVNFIIEIDRRGNKQAVFYQCGNKEFQNYILSFGFDKQTGSYSDVSTLSTHYNIAGCNLSAGYYNEHSTQEHIYLDHLYNTINAIKEILKDTKNHKFYDCQEIVYKTYDYSDYWSKYCSNRKSKEIEEDEKEELEKDEIEDNLSIFDKLEENDEEDVLEDILQKEDDYYALSNKQWKKKYKQDKPADVFEIYNDYDDYFNV